MVGRQLGSPRVSQPMKIRVCILEHLTKVLELKAVAKKQEGLIKPW